MLPSSSARQTPTPGSLEVIMSLTITGRKLSQIMRRNWGLADIRMIQSNYSNVPYTTQMLRIKLSSRHPAWEPGCFLSFLWAEVFIFSLTLRGDIGREDGMIRPGFCPSQIRSTAQFQDGPTNMIQRPKAASWVWANSCRVEGGKSQLQPFTTSELKSSSSLCFWVSYKQKSLMGWKET